MGIPQVASKFFLHAFRNVVLPVFGPQCIITMGRCWNSNVVGEATGRDGMDVATSKSCSYCVVRFHCLASAPQVICAV